MRRYLTFIGGVTVLLVAGASLADGQDSVRTERARVCAGGDVTLGTNLDTVWVRRMAGRMTGRVPDLGVSSDSAVAALFLSPMSIVAPLRPLIEDASVVLINVEGAIGDGAVDSPKCVAGRPQCFVLRSAASAAHAIRTMVDPPALVVANLANNHTHDAGTAGFETTTALLDSAGVLVTGIDTEPTIAVTPGGDTIAFLGFSAWTDPGVEDLETVRRLVARAATRYRRVVVTAHLGAEGRLAQRTPDSLEQFAGERRGNPIAFAHAAVDAGAGLVVGHGPHVLRAAEWRNGALIFYSLGNLINYGPFRLSPPMDRGALVCATLDSAGRPSDVVLHSTRQLDVGIVRPDARHRASTLVDSLSRIDFPSTGAAVDRGTGAVTPRRHIARPTSRPRTIRRQ